MGKRLYRSIYIDYAPITLRKDKILGKRERLKPILLYVASAPHIPKWHFAYWEDHLYYNYNCKPYQHSKKEGEHMFFLWRYEGGEKIYVPFREHRFVIDWLTLHDPYLCYRLFGKINLELLER